MDIVSVQGTVDHRDVFFSSHQKQANEQAVRLRLARHAAAAWCWIPPTGPIELGCALPHSQERAMPVEFINPAVN